MWFLSLIVSSDQAILDFSRPRSRLYGARLISLDGRNINAPSTKTSFWIDPAPHEIVIAAGISAPMQAGRAPAGRIGEDPGKVKIETESGTRYKIATRIIDQRGAWNPMIWKVEDL
ncbi:MAG: hypothetical protein JSW21_03515 [Gammaproteobacteria bacterium]|nr:MAG: hypothetical protein JSW21_03515 [Gammaproteobacteria bacterium]